MMSVTAARPGTVTVKDIEVFAEDLDVQQAAAIYKEHGCLVVRGLLKEYTDQVARDIETAAQESIALLDRAQKVTEGWVTPNGTLFLPAPPGYPRDKQIMVLGISYMTSSAFFRSAFDEKLVNLVSAILGENVELFMNGQCLLKEPVGGHPKHLHQDSAYFEHRFEGPVGVLNYVVDTDLVNGALHVVPGSHQMGTLRHVDTFSHLGLDAEEWPWESAVPVCGSAGDSIFFHYRCIHGSKENHSNKPRPVYIHRYRRPDDFVTVGATTAQNREQSERRAAEARKTNQRGFMVRGFRAYSEEG